MRAGFVIRCAVVLTSTIAAHGENEALDRTGCFTPARAGCLTP
jgi:hypothetical protein